MLEFFDFAKQILIAQWLTIMFAFLWIVTTIFLGRRLIKVYKGQVDLASVSTKILFIFESELKESKDEKVKELRNELELAKKKATKNNTLLLGLSVGWIVATISLAIEKNKNKRNTDNKATP